MQKLTLTIMVALLLLGCNKNSNATQSNQSQPVTTNQTDTQPQPELQSKPQPQPKFDTQTLASFDEPWAVAVISQGDKPPQFLVTQRSGSLVWLDSDGNRKIITGVPAVAYGGQGGLGDVILAPDFAKSHDIYLSYAEAGTNDTRGAKVIRATLSNLDTPTPSLTNIRSIWTQTPKVTGMGHYSHKLLLSPDKQHLFISSGDRQKGTPAQDMSVNLGKIIRLNLDGSVPKDNPFADKGGVTAQIWSLGHRNTYGLAFDNQGNLWQNEMGPKGGDELNLITKGQNYGWSVVSNGINYDGSDIPDHATHPEFIAPKLSWTPVISPSSLTVYQKGTQHDDFPMWQQHALIGGLSSQALIVVDLDMANQNESAQELYRYDMGQRIRDVKVVDGQVYLLEDGKNGRLLKLKPVAQ